MATDHVTRLTDHAWRIQRRAALYHALLQRWIAGNRWIWDERSLEHPEGYFYCGMCHGTGMTQTNVMHEDGCIVAETVRALAADADGVAALLRAMGDGDA